MVEVDKNEQEVADSSRGPPAEAGTNKAVELKKFLESNPDCAATMFKVYAHLFDEPKQVKTTQA